jgi:HlyD family secretion protein
MNNPASVIGTVADLSEVLAEVDVDETEVVDVRPGLPAEVVVDALPDVRYAGEVVEVGSSGYTRPAQPDVQFFRVKILLSAPDERLRPGMSARAEIRVTTHDGALAVPIQTVVERAPAAESEAEKSAVDAASEIPVAFVVDGDEVRKRPIRTGISDATHVEVVEGLSETDRVVTGPYRSLKKLRDGDRIRIADARADREKEAAEKEEAGVEVEVD